VLVVMAPTGIPMSPKVVPSRPLSMVVRPMYQEEMPGPVAMASQICSGVASMVACWWVS
jgi:hypothetical protein